MLKRRRVQWNNTQKWVVANCDFENVDLTQLKLCLESEDNSGSFVASALHFSTTGVNISIVNMLLDYKIPINGKDSNGASPLHWACKHGNLSIIKLLLERNADVLQMDYGTKFLNINLNYFFLIGILIYILIAEHNTILHYAVVGGNMEVISFLVENVKCNVDARNKYNESPLILACTEENSSIIKYFGKKSKSVHNVLQFFVENNYPRPLAYLVKNTDISITSFNGPNPLYFSMKAGYHRVTKVLLYYSSWLQEYTDTEGNKAKDLLRCNTTEPNIVGLFVMQE